MTYCVGLLLNDGLIFLSDTRTNAGIDNISRYRKMFTWEVPGERSIVLMTAGNLAVTQAVVSLLDEGIEDPVGSGVRSILEAPTMFRIAEIVGEAVLSVQKKYSESLSQMKEAGGATLILGGQRTGGAARLFLIYSEGNFIEATEDTPYLQIGEHKYGKPILDRVVTTETPLNDAVKAALLSMDSTLRSNLSVGMPLDLAVLPASVCQLSERRRIEPDDVEFHALSEAWSQSLRDAFQTIT